jgi:hypothetical protein
VVLLKALVLSDVTLHHWASCCLHCLHIQVQSGLFGPEDEGAVILQNIQLLAQQHSITLQNAISFKNFWCFCVVGMFMLTVIKLKKLEWLLAG